ncbi:hypothetical protein F3Y22_tig00117016pilonHSYRG00370 [Hibiscus syriacus]|uniref:Uncharacterized protein n=1 Tax=Hibiscus syriacus TaxID=106335 RepID=A0A6A2XBX5_HIBSY|nr:hypothetical protein F3Y22_tig00117016pilonHSYRG00370 [Hibiscus syriacus]
MGDLDSPVSASPVGSQCVSKEDYNLMNRKGLAVVAHGLVLVMYPL